jgi:hypothetical protein
MVIRGTVVKNYPDRLEEGGGGRGSEDVIGLRPTGRGEGTVNIRAHEGGWLGGTEMRGGERGRGEGGGRCARVVAIDHESVYRFFGRAPCGYL